MTTGMKSFLNLLSKIKKSVHLKKAAWWLVTVVSIQAMNKDFNFEIFVKRKECDSRLFLFSFNNGGRLF
jgi:hypothetical protein